MQLDELGEGTAKLFDVNGERIAVAVIDGAYFGFEDARLTSSARSQREV